MTGELGPAPKRSATGRRGGTLPIRTNRVSDVKHNPTAQEGAQSGGVKTTLQTE